MFGPIPDVEQRTEFNYRIFYAGRIYDVYYAQSFSSEEKVWCLWTCRAVKLGEFATLEDAIEAVVMKNVP